MAGLWHQMEELSGVTALAVIKDSDRKKNKVSPEFFRIGGDLMRAILTGKG